MNQIRIAVLAVLIAGSSIALAGPASADPLNGTYTSTLTNAAGKKATTTYVFTSCGADCVHLADPPRDYHLEGNAWVVHTSVDPDCGEIIDQTALAGEYHCGVLHFPLQLTKIG